MGGEEAVSVSLSVKFFVTTELIVWLIFINVSV